MQAVLIYSAAYAVMNLGAFFVIDLVGEEAKSYNGLFRTRPGVALSMAIFMAALVGIPPLSGFWGKLWVILAGVESGSVLVYVTVGVLVVNSVLSVPYYFGILRNMAFEEPVKGRRGAEGCRSSQVLRLHPGSRHDPLRLLRRPARGAGGSLGVAVGDLWLYARLRIRCARC